jgi:hypothetical protein
VRERRRRRDGGKDGTHLEVVVHHERGGERQDVGREHGVEGREDVAVQLFMQRHGGEGRDKW